MSWMADEWKSDLSHRAMKKVAEIEAQMQRYKKEAEIKQFKIDSIEQVIQKEKKRVEEEKSQVASLKREVQTLSESCQGLEEKRQKIAAELHTKENHIGDLNGQLAHKKKLLEQEIAKVSQLQASVEKIECQQAGQSDKYEKLSTDHEKLKQQNQHLEKESSALRTECNTLKQKSKDTENQIMALQSDNENLKIQLKDQTSGKASEFKHVSEQLKLEKENLKILEKRTSEEIKTLKNLLDVKERDMDKMRAEAQAKEDKITGVLKALTVEFQNYKESGGRKNAQEAQAKAKMEQDIGELKNLLSTKEQEHSQLLKDTKFLRDSLTNAQTSTETLKSDVKKKDDCIAKMKQSTDNMQKDLDKQNEELMQVKQLSEERLKKLQNQLENLKDEKKSIENLATTKQNEAISFKEDLENVKTERDGLIKKLTGIEQTKNTMCSTLTDLKTAMEKLVSVNGLQKQNIEEFKNINTEKEREIDGLRKEIEHKNDRIETISKQLEKTRTDAANAEEEKLFLKSEIEAKLADSESEKTKLECELNVALSNATRTKDELETMTKDYDRLKTDVDSLNDTNIEYKTLVEKLTIEKEETEKLYNKKCQEIEHMEETLKSVKEELKEATSVKLTCEKVIEEKNFVIVNLESTITDLNNKNVNSQNIEEQLKNDLNKLKVENERFLSLNKSQENKLDEFKSEIEENKSLVQSYKDKIEELNTFICSLKDELAENKHAEEDAKGLLTQQITKLESDCENKCRLITDLENQLLNKSGRLEATEKEILSMQDVTSELNARLRQFEHENEELHLRCSENEKLLERNIEKNASLEEEANAMKDDMNKINIALRDTQEELNLKKEEMLSISEIKQSELATVETELDHARQEIENLKLLNEKEMENKHLNALKISELEAEIEINSSAVDDLKKKIDDASVLKGQLQSDIQIWKDKFNTIEADYNNTKANLCVEIDGLKEECLEKQSKIDHIENLLDKKTSGIEEIEKTKDLLSAELIDKNNVISSLETQIDELKNELENAGKKESEYVSKIERISNSLKEAEDELSDKEMDYSIKEATFKQKITEHNNILEGKETEIETLKDKNSLLFEQVEDLRRNLEELGKQKDELSIKGLTLEKECEENLHAIDTFKGNEAKLQNDISDLNKEMIILKDKLCDESMDSSISIAKLNQDVKDLQSTLETKEADIEILTVENRNKTEELRKKETDLDELKALNSEHDLAILELKKHIEQLQTVLNETETKEQKAEEKVSQLHTELSELKDAYSRENSTKTAEITQLCMKIEELENILHEKTTQLDELKTNFESIQRTLKQKEEEDENKLVFLNKLKMEILEKGSELDSVQTMLTEVTLKFEKGEELISSMQTTNQELKDELADMSVEESVFKAQHKHEVQSLQDSIKAKCTDLKDLDQRLCHKDEEMEKLQQLNGEMNRSLIETEAKLNTVQGELQSLQNVCEMKDTELDEKSATIAAMSERIEVLLTDLNVFQDQNGQLKSEIKSLNDNIEEHDTKFGLTKNELDRNEEKLSLLEKETIELKDKLCSQSIETSAHISRLNQENVDLNSEVLGKDADIKKITLEIGIKTDELNKTLFDLNEFKSKNAELILKVSELESNIEQLQTLVNETEGKEQAANDKILQLQAAQGELKDDYAKEDSKKTTEIAGLHLNKEELENIIHGKNTQLEEVNACLEELQKDFEQKEDEYVRTLKLVNDLKTEVLEKGCELDSFQALLKEVNEKLEKSDELVTSLQKANQELKDELSDMGVEESVFKAQFKHEIQSLQDSYDAKCSELHELEQRLSHKDEEIERLQQLNVEINVSQKNALEKLNAVEVELESLRHDSEKKDIDIAEKSGKVTTLTERLEICLLDLASAQDEKEQLNLEIVTLKDQVEEHTFNLKQTKEELDKKEETLSEFEDANIKLKDRLHNETTDSSVRIVKLNQEIEDLKSSVTEKEADIEKFSSEISNKTEELNQTTSDLNDYKTKNSEYTLKISELESNVEQLQNLLSKTKEMEGVAQTKVLQLQTDIGDMKDSYNSDDSKKSTEIAELCKVKEELENTIYGKDLEIGELKTHLENLKMNLEKREEENGMINKKSKDIEMKILEKESELDSAKCSLTDMTLNLEKNDELITSLQKTNQELRDKLGDMGIEESVFKAQLKCEMQTLQDSYDAKCSEMNDVIQSIENKDKDFEKLQNLNENFNAAHLEAMEKVNALSSEIESLKSDNDKKDADIAEQSANIMALTEKAGDSFKEMLSIQDEKEQLKIEIMCLKNRNEEYENELSMTKEDIVKKDERLVVIQRESESLKDALKSYSLEETNNKAQFSCQIEELENSLEDKSQSYSKAKKELEHVHEELDMCKDQQAKTELEVVSLKSEIHEKEARIDELESTLLLNEQEINKLRSNDSDSEHQVQQLKDKLHAICLEKEEISLKLNQEIDNLQCSIVCFKKEKEDLGHELSHITQQCNKAIQDLQESTEKHENILLENTDLKNKIELIDFELKNLKLTMEKNEGDVTDSNEQIALLKNKIDETELEKNTIEAKSNQVIQDLTYKVQEKERELSEVEEKVTVTLNQLAEKIEATEMLDKLNSKTELEKSALSNEMEQLEFKLKELNEIIEENTDKVLKLEAELFAAKEELNDVKNASSSNLAAQVAQVEEYKRNIKLLEESENTSQQEKDTLIAQIRELNHAKYAADMLVDELQCKCSKLEKDVNESDFSYKNLEEEKLRLEEVLEQKEKQIIELKDSISRTEFNATDSLTELELMKKDLHAKLSQKSTELENAEQRVEKLNDDLLKAKVFAEDLEKIVNEQSGEITNSKQKNEEAKWMYEDKIKCLENEKELIQDALSTFETKLKISEEEVQSLQNRYELVEEALKHKTHDILKYENENHEFSRKIEALESNKAEYINNLERQEVEMNNLKTEICELEQKLGDQSGDLKVTQLFSQNIQSQLEEIDSDNKSLQEKIYKISTEKEELLVMHEQSKEELQVLERELKNVKSNAAETVDRLTEEKEILETHVSRLEDSVRNKDETIADLQIKQDSVRELERCNAKYCEKIADIEDEMSKLLERLDLLESNKKELEDQIQDTVLEKQSLEASLQCCREEKMKNINECDVLSADLFEAKEKLACVLTEKCKMETTFKSMELEITSLKETLDLKESEIIKLKSSSCDLKEEMSSVEEVKKELNEELRKIQTELEQTEVKLRNIEAEKQELESMVEFTSMESTSKEDELASLRKELDETSIKNCALANRLRDVEQELQVKRDKLSEVEDSLELAQTEKRVFEEKFKEMNVSKTSSSSLIDDLQTEVKNAKYEFDNLKDMFESLEFENSSLETEKVELEKKIQYFVEEKKTNHDTIAELENALHVNEADTSEKISNIQHAFNEEKERMTDEMDTFKSKLKELKRKYDDECKQVKDLNEEKVVILSKLESLEITVSSSNSQKAEVDQLQRDKDAFASEITVLKERLERQEKEKGDLLGKFLSLEDMFCGSEKTCKDLSQQLDDLIKKKEEVEKEMQEQKKLNDEIHSELSKVLAQCEDLKKTKDTLGTELEKLQQSQKKDAERIASINKLTTLLRERNATCKNELTTLKEEKVELKAQLQQASDGRKDLEDRLNAAQTLVAEKEKKLKLNIRPDLMSPKTYKTKVSQMQAELESLRTQVEAYSRGEKGGSGEDVSKDDEKEKTKQLETELEKAKKEAEAYLNRYHILTKRYAQLEAKFVKLQQQLNTAGSQGKLTDGSDIVNSGLNIEATACKGKHKQCGLNENLVKEKAAAALSGAEYNNKPLHSALLRQRNWDNVKSDESKDSLKSDNVKRVESVRAEDNLRSGNKSKCSDDVISGDLIRSRDSVRQGHGVIHDSSVRPGRVGINLKTAQDRDISHLAEGRHSIAESITLATEANVTKSSVSTEVHTEAHTEASQPAMKRQKSGDIGESFALAKLTVEEEKTPKRKSPRTLSRLRSMASAPKTTLESADSSSTVPQQATAPSLHVNITGKKPETSALSGRRTQASKPVSGKSGPKGLRPTLKPQKDKTSLSLQCDMDTTNYSMANKAASEVSGKEGKGPCETVSSSNKYSLTTKPLSRLEGMLSPSKKSLLSKMKHAHSQIYGSEEENDEDDSMPKPLGTLTNSPLKKGGATDFLQAPPQKGALSLGKSPHQLRTRRKLRDDTEEKKAAPTEGKEGDPECKVS